VAVPPLRDRTEDIADLVHYFLNQVGADRAERSLSIAPEAMELLCGHEWPGNVRELENLCRRAAALCTGQTISAEMIEPWLGESTSTMEGLGSLREGRMLEDMERRLIERMLGRYNGHRAKTAKALGMGIRTLGMKLKQWREAGEEVAFVHGNGSRRRDEN
jgi:DNA-binding NtrC family response regulator